MFTRKSALAVVVVLAVVALAQNAWYWSVLPERVAIHFNAQGESDSWMSKTAAALMMCGVQIGLPLFLVGVTWSTKFLPSSIINIPNREYWLRPERREKSLADVNQTMAWVAALASLFMIGINHLTFVANRHGEGLRMGWFALALVVYLAMVFTLVGRMAWRFRLPRDAAAKPVSQQ